MAEAMRGDPTGSVTVGAAEAMLGGNGGDPWRVALKVATILVPIIFTAGTLWYQFGTMSKVVDAHATQIRAVEDRATELGTDQKLLRQELTTMGAQQQQISNQLQRVSEKIDAQAEDLAAIRERIGRR